MLKDAKVDGNNKATLHKLKNCDIQEAAKTRATWRIVAYVKSQLLLGGDKADQDDPPSQI